MKWLAEIAAPRSRGEEAGSSQTESAVGAAKEHPQPPTCRPEPTRLPLFSRWVAARCLNASSAGVGEYLIGTQRDVRFYPPTTGFDPCKQSYSCYSDLGRKWIF